jgi:hypothetical protein
MNVIEFRYDRVLGGSLPHMARPETQERWDVFLKAVDGLPMTERELDIFREHTNRQVPRPGGYPEAAIISGRQAGKDITGRDLVVACAVDSLITGRNVRGMYALLIAQDNRSAIRTTFSYVSEPFEQISMLSRHVAGRTVDSLLLDNGLTIAAYPCRPAAVRGLRSAIVVLNELGFFRVSEAGGSTNTAVDVEMIRAVRPTLATTGGKLIVMSSPYFESGALWELRRRNFGREDSPTLVWQATAPQMNPTLPADYLERMLQDDPEGYRAEVLGEFRSGQGVLLEPAAIDAIVGDYVEQLPKPGVVYHCFADPSGGRGDSTTVAAAHTEDTHVIVDAVRSWDASILDVAAEVAAFVKSYGTSTVTGDNYGADNTVAALRQHAVTYVPRPTGYDKSRLYLEFLPVALARAVTIPNDPVLIAELRGLRRRRGFAGRDRVDHASGISAHDDRANSLAGAVYLARTNTFVPVMPISITKTNVFRVVGY